MLPKLKKRKTVTDNRSHPQNLDLGLGQKLDILFIIFILFIQILL